MSKRPFIDDPRDVVKRNLTFAVASPIEEVRAIHIQTAGHFAEVAEGSKLPMKKPKAVPSHRSGHDE